MSTILLVLAVLAVLFGAAALLTSDRPVLADAPPDAADAGLPTGPVQPEDVAALRFSMAPRGYRMAEVDDVLDRLAAELADRDRRLTLLEATMTDGLPPAPASDPAPAPASAPASAPEAMWNPQQWSAGDSTEPRRPEAQQPQAAQQPQWPPHQG